MLLDIRPEGGEQSVKTHFSLVTLDGVWVLAGIVLESHESLQKAAVLAGEALAA